MLNEKLKFIRDIGRTMLLVAVLLGVLSVSAKAQQLTSVYLYDDNGRLTAVIQPDGTAFVYEYDPAGNFTGTASLSSDTLRIIAFLPRRGPIGTRVTIYGTGFSSGVTGVTFNGVSARIIQTSATSIATEVPAGATTGPITVFTNSGSAVSATPFTVRGVMISPRAVTVSANESTPFSAVVSGLPTTDVVWSVDNIPGGSTTVGTISPNGIYTAPNLLNSPPLQFIVRAAANDDPSEFDEAVVTVLSAGEGYQFRTDAVSVRYGAPPVTSPIYPQSVVSVRYGTPLNSVPVENRDQVSVRYGSPPNAVPTYSDDKISVRYGAAPDSVPVFTGSAVSVGSGPYLTSLSPVSITRGGSATLNITGIGLNNASSVQFFRVSNGTSEPGIIVSNIGTNGQGTTLTATISVNANVAAGQFVVVVVTPSGATVRSRNNANVIQVQ